MKVLVTGAAGRLGTHVARQLSAAGHEVLATDRVGTGLAGAGIEEADLLDESAVSGMMRGIEAVAHLGNHPGLRPEVMSPSRTFSENMAMNMNVFHAANAAGVKRVIFASSMQVVASEADSPLTPAHAHQVAYLPLDHASPANPTNPYALSKYLGERMLEDYFAPRGMSGVAVRYPALFNPPGTSRFRLDREPSRVLVAQGFSALSYSDAASLIVAILGADLAGFRVYLPALSAMTGNRVGPAVERYYPGVPLKRPVDRIESLVDMELIQRETGWRALDPLPLPFSRE